MWHRGQSPWDFASQKLSVTSHISGTSAVCVGGALCIVAPHISGRWLTEQLLSPGFFTLLGRCLTAATCLVRFPTALHARALPQVLFLFPDGAHISGACGISSSQEPGTLAYPSQ